MGRRRRIERRRTGRRLPFVALIGTWRCGLRGGDDFFAGYLWLCAEREIRYWVWSRYQLLISSFSFSFLASRGCTQPGIPARQTVTSATGGTTGACQEEFAVSSSVCPAQQQGAQTRCKVHRLRWVGLLSVIGYLICFTKQPPQQLINSTALTRVNSMELAEERCIGPSE